MPLDPNTHSRRVELGRGQGWLSLFLCLVLAALAPACRVIQGAANVPSQAVQAMTPGSGKEPTKNPMEVQAEVMRLSDEFLTTMVYGLNLLRRGTNALDAEQLLKWKMAFGTETCSIASGPNPIGNLLDLTVFVAATRAAVAGYWQPQVFGESAQPILDGCRDAETNAWRLVDQWLTPEHQAELRKSIDIWIEKNPLSTNMMSARAVGFASQVAAASPKNQSSSGSVFSLLMLDPLSGLDPATREIAHTRMLAERALYVSQKMPMLLRWQVELLSLNTVQLPAVQQLVTNATQIAASSERFATLAEQLPDKISAERAEILKALQSQEKDVSSLLVSGRQMSDSLNTTLTTFDGLMQRFGVGETNNTEPPSTNAEPFRILDYAQTATQLESAARQLTELLVTLDQTLGSTNLARLSAQVGPVVEQAQTGGKEVVDYAFWKGILLVLIALAAALVYRFLASRIGLSRTKSNSP